MKLRIRPAVAALVVVAAALTGSDAAAQPADHVAMRGQLSTPDHPHVVRGTQHVEMSDGTRLYVEVVRPDPGIHGDGPWPVILEASPYHGTLAGRIGDRIFPDPRSPNGQPLGLTGYFAPRGYAVVMVDLRGTGRSTGCLDHLGPRDARDLYEIVEWAALQPWSSGRVGMTGHSYVGSTPTVAAAQRPRGLVTIVPSAGLASMYDHQFQRGVPYNLQYVGPMAAYPSLALQRDLPPGSPPVPVTGGGGTGDNWGAAPNPQTGCGWTSTALLAGSGQVTGQYELWHAQRDWTAQASDVDIPVFMIHGVNDNAARIPAAEWFFARRHVRPGDKVWIGQWDHGGSVTACVDTLGRRRTHPTCRFAQFQYALHAWFDRHLKQRDVDTGPAVEAFLNGRAAGPPGRPPHGEAKVVTPGSWGPPSRRLELGLSADRTLGPGPQAGQVVFATTAEAVATNLGRGFARFTSDPVPRDTVLLGLPSLTLNASVVSSQVTHLVATLYRIDAEGARDHMSTCAIQPQLRHGVTTVAPVIPGQEMSLPMSCFTMAHWVPAGDRLSLEVSTAGPHHVSFGTSVVTVHTGPGRSRMLLPVVDAPLHDDVPLG
ncbi:MAG TPA: CocE/NonD family hydrolase [Actinomycetota bacterium]|nr:CocE/NonD family hydrolase [Actinomycetota bacterium]